MSLDWDGWWNHYYKNEADREAVDEKHRLELQAAFLQNEEMKRQIRYMKANEAVHSASDAKTPEPFTKEWGKADLIRRAELAEQEMEQAILRADVQREARNKDFVKRTKDDDVQFERIEKEKKASNSLFYFMLFGIIILIGARTNFK